MTRSATNIDVDAILATAGARTDGLPEKFRELKRDYPTLGNLLQRYGGPLPALREFASMCRRAENYELAVDAIVNGLSFAPDDVRLWRDLSTAYEQLAQDDLAETCLRKALELEIVHADTWLRFARISCRNGRAEDAEEALLCALALDPGLSEASIALGELYLDAGRYEDAAERFVAAIQLRDGRGYLGLGRATYLLAEFAESEDAFENAAILYPLEVEDSQQYARAQAYTVLLSGNGDDGRPTFSKLPAAIVPSFVATAGQPLQPLRLFVDTDVWRSEDRTSLELNESRKPLHRLMIEAAVGNPLISARYVETYYDRCAERYDDALFDDCRYHVPEELSKLISRHRSAFSGMADLGCGTGLAGKYLKAFGSELVGVDLSSEMLLRTARRRTHCQLVKDEAGAYLRGCSAQFELVFAADLLIHFGNLEGIVDRIAGATKRGECLPSV